jgi:hypothetical protein
MKPYLQWLLPPVLGWKPCTKPSISTKIGCSVCSRLVWYQPAYREVGAKPNPGEAQSGGTLQM